MIVVSDTSPLRYLAVFGWLDLLPRLFGSVAIPRVVLQELLASSAPPAARHLAENPPEWLVVHDEPPQFIGALAAIDPGECAAILLAERLHAALVLMDDEDGRDAARERGIAVTGLIGIFGRASQRGMLDFDEAITRLRATNFRVSDSAVLIVRKNIGLQ